jgi:olefin beta-lactone synthetase
MLAPSQRADPVDSANANIARHLARMADAQPSRVAIKIPRGRTPSGDIDYLALTFAELHAEVSAWSTRLTAAGVRRGDRTLVMVRQGLPLIASAFAVFQIGAVPVIIDPGMGRKSFLACIRQSQPRALIGIPFAQLLSRIFRPSFRSVAVRVTASSSLTGRLSQPSSPGVRLPAEPRGTSDLAAILFTSGSTGAPKGVCYEHGMFDAQVRLIRETYGIEPGEIDLPLLPIFALFNPALGMTTIVPEIDPRHPAELNPANIVRAIQQERVTNSFGSPTLWRNIGDHCVATGTTLPTLRRVLCAGAPVPAALWQSAPTFLVKGQLHSPYGATEALPVASVSAPEIDPASVRGACVGRPVPEMSVRIIAISDAPIATIAESKELPPGQIGEIIVRGPVVTKEYDAAPDATAAAKIADEGTDRGSSSKGQAQVPDSSALAGDHLDTCHLPLATSSAASAAPTWHRMGDCGYFDSEGRLWFCGRKVERVETAQQGTLHTEPCEQVFRAHPRVTRCALIGLGERGRQRPALVVEADIKDSAICRRFARELSALGQQHPHTVPVRVFYFHPKFPVDVRHNAKIHRLALARWAATVKGFEIEPKR